MLRRKAASQRLWGEVSGIAVRFGSKHIYIPIRMVPELRQGVFEDFIFFRPAIENRIVVFRVRYGVCDVGVIYMIQLNDMMHIYTNKLSNIDLRPLIREIILIYWRSGWQRRHSCDIILNYRCMRDGLQIFMI